MNRKKIGAHQDFSAMMINNLTGTIIQFPVMPQSISETISANFAQQDIVGASRPRVTYSSTSAKTMNISLQNLTEDYVAEGFDSLLQYVRAIQALAYPMYNAGIVKSPDITLFLGNRVISCVCTNVSVTWGNLITEQQIRSCNIDMALLVTRDDVPGATEIQNNINSN